MSITKQPLDLVALQRALVFTKLDYRRPVPTGLSLDTTVVARFRAASPATTALPPIPAAARPGPAEPLMPLVGLADVGLFAEATWVEHATAEVVSRIAAPASGVRRTDPFEPDDHDDLVEVSQGLIPWTCD